MPECLSANLALVAVGGVAGAWQAFAVALFEHTQTTFAAGPTKQEMGTFSLRLPSELPPAPQS